MIMFSHLDVVSMTYLEHLRISLYYFFLFLLAAFKAFIHAFIPDFYQTSTHEAVNEILFLLKKNNKLMSSS